MKKLGLGLGLVIALLSFWPGTAQLKVAQNRNTGQQRITTPAQIDTQDPFRNYDQKHADFNSGHELLIRKGVPFDPDILLEADWRERIQPFLGQMAQMSQVRRGSNKMSGAQLADTLYLPEKIELTGDTIIVARRLVFEGRQTLIKGPHNIYAYIIEPEISTLSQASLTRKRNPRLTNISFTETEPPQSNDDMTVTVDVSGFGYKEWLEQHAAARSGRKPDRVQISKAGYHAHSQQSPPPQNGTNGQPATEAIAAINGTPAIPLFGTKGPNGVCGNATTVNGLIGQGGGGGGDAGDGNTGGSGGNGGGGGTIWWTVGSTGTYIFEAHGGDGAPGAPGSVGGTGAPGGTGGQGGDGKDCPCNQGGAGSGGQGGPAGPGGIGGVGGNGGPGGFNGTGGTVHITKPYGSNPNFIINVAGGTGGQGGIGQGPGPGGSAGSPGPGGTGVNGGSCGSGNTGISGTVAGAGPAGPRTGNNGASRQPGANGSVTVCLTTPPSGGCPGGTWVCNTWQCSSPIIIDTNGDGFDLTDAEGGVNFDFFGNGQPVHLSWTSSSADDSWLTLDRNGNGMVESGQELFGNLTPQPASDHPNGFIALAVYDKPGEGGNGDGLLDHHDAIFPSLRLWQDTNHNGISELGELHTLPDLDVESITLEYKESKRTDQYGNAFRFRAKISGPKKSSVGRWAYDVFLVRAP